MTGLETTLAILSGIKKILQEISENMSEELTTQDKHNISEWCEWARSCRSLVSYEFNQLEKLQSELTKLKAEKSGVWVGITDNLSSEKYFCSLCDIKAISKLSLCENDNGTLEYKVVELLTNYCPNCGAKMKKEENQ